MIRQHSEDRGRAPPLTGPIMRRRPRRIIYILLALLVLYILIVYEPVPLPVLARTPKETTYDTYPTYEYVSFYREKADKNFEAIIDEKLRNLEAEIIKGLPNGQTRDTVVTNLTIWQLTNEKAAADHVPWTDQWKNNNGDWAYQLFTGTPGSLYEHFESVPEIAYMNFTTKAVQDDLTRQALRDCNPIATVLNHGKNAGLMIGVDRDEPYLSDATLKDWQWARGVGFGQAAIWATMRFDPIIRKAIVRTISHAWTHEAFEDGTWREKYTAKVEGVIMEKLTLRTDYTGEISGNGMFTDLVLETLSATLKKDHKLRDRDAGLEKRVTWKKFWKLKEILWLDRDQLNEGSEDDIRSLAVLPINIWGNGKSHSRSGSFEVEEACINQLPNWKPKKDMKKKIFG